VQTLEEATALGATARKKGLVLNHAMTVRLESRHLALRSALPRIGRPISAHIRYFGGGGWYLDGALRGDRWLAFEVHFLDQYEDLLGETQWLAASCVDGPERSCGAVLAGYPEGATLAMEFGMGFAYKPGYAATIVGERGYLWFERGEVGGEDASGTFEVPGPVSDTIARDSDSFVEQVLDGAPAVCPWPQGLRAMQLALLAGRAAREGARLAVPPLPTA
jgi:predicted dehydrogenase